MVGERGFPTIFLGQFAAVIQATEIRGIFRMATFLKQSRASVKATICGTICGTVCARKNGPGARTAWQCIGSVLVALAVRNSN